MANRASILARCRREADTSSAAAHRENTATGEGETGVAVTGTAVIGAAIGGVIDSPVDLVTRTTGVGTLLGAGAFLTHTRITAIILIGIILRIGTIMIITIAPYQEGSSLGLDPYPCDLQEAVRRNRLTPEKGIVGIGFTVEGALRAFDSQYMAGLRSAD
jgi:hypothetical protein